jgi:ubiquinone/menaquinone biosynthesis C-methylase UbiE
MHSMLEQRAARTPAEVYDELFVPALFQKWGPILSEAANLRHGQRVLDVACGTGALTRAAAERVGPNGSVVGLDPNPSMLSVARRKSTAIEWCEGRAEELCFPDASFDAVVSQFGFMFFDDRPRALREMMRVLRPGGHLAVAVCDALEHSPGYATLASLLAELFGEGVAARFRAPFSLGDPRELARICEQAELCGACVAQHDESVSFASIESLVSTERACAWTLGGLLDDAQFERLLAHASLALGPFAGADGAVTFAMPALIITATKPTNA